MEKLVPIGRLFFAIAIVAFGLEHILHADFVTRVIPYWPAWIPPGSVVWAYLCGVALVVAGGAIIFRFQEREFALALGGGILLSVVCLYLPMLAKNYTNGGLFTNTFKAIALSGGAFAVARTYTNPPSDGLLWIGRVFLGSFLIVAGILHFVYTDFVATLVPNWIPGHVFWTYFAAVALIAGGIGMMTPRVARLAALLSGAMIFTWFIILHIPRALAPPHSVNELVAVFEALAMSGIAFVLAGSAPRNARR